MACAQWPMLKQRWLIILFGIVMQYVHGIFTQLAHRMHQPQAEPLHDVGFALTPVSCIWGVECLRMLWYQQACAVMLSRTRHGQLLSAQP